MLETATITEEVEEFANANPEQDMPTLNHSNLCADIMEQIWEDRTFKPLPELTLDIGNGITPDISVYLRERMKPDYWHDVVKYPEMPLLAIEAVSPSQGVQGLVEKAETLLAHGVKAVWVVEPVTKSIVVVTPGGKKALHNQVVESEGVKVDFRRIFGDI
jgi:Uma2 family endonuclease